MYKDLQNHNNLFLLTMGLVLRVTMANEAKTLDSLSVKELMCTTTFIALLENSMRMSPARRNDTVNDTMSSFIRLWLPTPEKRQKAFFTDAEAQELGPNKLRLFLSIDAIPVMQERFFTVDQLKNIWFDHLCCLFSKRGLEAIRKRLFTKKQALELSQTHVGYLKALVSENGFKAMEWEFITPDVALEMPTCYLNELFSKNGMQAMTEELITAAEASKMPSLSCLQWLLSDEGLAAMREGRMTPQKVINLTDRVDRHILQCVESFDSLREMVDSNETTLAFT